MKQNANYTWIICRECNVEVKIIPGQKFNSLEEWTALYKCGCAPETTIIPKRKVVKKEVEDDS